MATPASGSGAGSAAPSALGASFDLVDAQATSESSPTATVRLDRVEAASQGLRVGEQATVDTLMTTLDKKLQDPVGTAPFSL
jgi:hypothetical protein